MIERLIELVKLVWNWIWPFEILEPYMGGLILRLGRYHRPAKVGWNWIIPFGIESVCSTNIALETIEIGPLSLRSKDGIEFVITMVAAITKENLEIFLLQVNGADRVIEESVPGVLSELAMSTDFATLFTPETMGEAERRARVICKRRGVKLHTLQAKDFAKIRSIRLLQTLRNSHDYTTKEY